MTRNKILTLTVAPALAVALLAGAVQAQTGGDHGAMGGPGGPAGMMPDFATLDTDGDGKITREELEARRVERQRAMDPDDDGFITLEEMKAHASAEEVKRAEAMVDRMFARMDSDKDGKLSAAEALSRPMAAGGFDRMFGRVDRDGDGAISKEEFDRMSQMMQRHGDRKRGEGMRGDGRHGEGKHGEGKHGEGRPPRP